MDRLNKGKSTADGGFGSAPQRHGGLTTLLFTDLAGSVRLKDEFGDEAATALILEHHDVVRSQIARQAGAREIATAGDSFFITFESPADAVRFAAGLHAAMRSFSRTHGKAILDRVGIHLGEVFVDPAGRPGRPPNLMGLHVDTCARVMDVSPPGRTLITRTALEAAKASLRAEIRSGTAQWRFASHGVARCKGLAEPLEICEVGLRGEGGFEPIPDSAKVEWAREDGHSGEVREEGGSAGESVLERCRTAIRSRWRSGMFAAGVGLLALLMALFPDVQDPLSNLSYDTAYWFRPAAAPKEAVIVYMDSASAKALGQDVGKWDRALHASLIERLTRAGAKSVVFDVWFDQPQGGSGGTSPDELFVRAARANGAVFMAAVEESVPGTGGAQLQLMLPTESMRSGGRHGITEQFPTRAGARRHFHPRGRYEVPRLVSLVAAHWSGEGAKVSTGREDLWINFYGPPGTIPSVSYQAALNPSSAPDDLFRDRVVFVGVMANTVAGVGGGTDDFVTPYTGGRVGMSAGVEVLATVCLNLIRGDGLRRWPPSVELLFFVAVGSGLSFLMGLLRPLVVGVVAIASIGGLAVLAGMSAWAAHLWIPWAFPGLVQIPIGAACAVVLHTERLRREKRRLEAALMARSGGVERDEPKAASQNDRPIGLVTTKRAPEPVKVVGATPESIPSQGGKPPQIPDFQMLRQVGTGAYGEVWLALGEGGIYRAVKIVRSVGKDREEASEREFEGVRRFAQVSLEHPGLAKILHIGRSRENGWFYYVMELADDALREDGRMVDPDCYVPLTLAAFGWRSRSPGPGEGALAVVSRAPLDARGVASVGAELCETLSFLHERKLIHRDIKPANVLWIGGRPKLGDVGLVTGTEDPERSLTVVGTPSFMPPEGTPSPAGDVYAMGKLLYELAMRLPAARFPELPTDCAARGDLPQLIQLNDVILSACAADAAKRPSSADLAVRLRSIC